jgi:hypothetical protein
VELVLFESAAQSLAHVTTNDDGLGQELAELLDRRVLQDAAEHRDVDRRSVDHAGDGTARLDEAIRALHPSHLLDQLEQAVAHRQRIARIDIGVGAKIVSNRLLGPTQKTLGQEQRVLCGHGASQRPTKLGPEPHHGCDVDQIARLADPNLPPLRPWTAATC